MARIRTKRNLQLYMGTLWGQPHVTQVTTKASWIKDRNNGSLRPINSPVHHRYARYSPERLDVTHPDHSNGKFVSDDGNAHVVQVHAPKAIDNALGEDMLAQMWSSIEQRYASVAEPHSLLNFGFELRDIPKMVKYWKQSSYLSWEFGVAPFVRDLRIIVDNIRNAHDRYQDLVEHATKGTPRNLSAAAKRPASWDATLYGVHYSGSGSVTGRARGRVYTYLPGLSEISQEVTPVLDALGLHLDSTTLWDAIPFSWLVDWFLPIGDILSEIHDRRFIRPELSIQGSLSYKMTLTGEAMWVGSTKFIDPLPPYKVGSFVFTDYLRDGLDIGQMAGAKRHHSPFKIPGFDPKRSAILSDLGFNATRDAARTSDARRVKYRSYKLY